MIRLENSEKQSALITTLIVAVLFCLLFFWRYNRQIPSGESGLEVNFGNVNIAQGTFEPQEVRQIAQQQISPTTAQESSAKEMITQEDESSVFIEKKKKKEQEEKEKAAEIEKDRQKREKEQQQQAEEQRQADAIKAQMAGAFGKGNTASPGQGNASSGAGNQGKLNGDPNATSYGSGGEGIYDLGGRGIGTGGLKTPDFITNESGKIVIKITVSPSGEVILAEITRGTNITHSGQRNAALRAAKTTRFAPIEGANNQSGTITYTFKVK